jgi:hypothetical protein
MTSSADRIWQRIHQMAMQLARDKSLPSARHAEAIVLQMVREENIDLPDEHTVSSLADELRRATKFHPPQ